MDPKLRTEVNWLTFNLAQGGDYTSLLPAFEAKFGSIPQAEYDRAFDIASEGLANARNWSLVNVRSQLRNAFNLPGGRKGTVEIRMIVTYTDAAGHQMSRTFSKRFDYTQRVGDVYAAFASIAATKYKWKPTGMAILPGIYL